MLQVYRLSGVVSLSAVGREHSVLRNESFSVFGYKVVEAINCVWHDHVLNVTAASHV